MGVNFGLKGGRLSSSNSPFKRFASRTSLDKCKHIARARSRPRPAMGLRTWMDVVDDVLLQRWHTRGLPSDPKEVCGADVKGKTFIVTGPTSGIGTSTAETLAKLGARVVLACRTVARGEALVAQWRREHGNDKTTIDCEVMLLDLDSLDSVRAFARKFLAKKTKLHVLINNAGVFDMSGSFVKTKDGFEQHWGVNYIAPALLTLLLMPALGLEGEAKNPARVVFVTSKLHAFADKVDLTDASFDRRKYGARAAYAQSKLAELLFARALEKRLLNVVDESSTESSTKSSTGSSIKSRTESSTERKTKSSTASKTTPEKRETHVRCVCVHPGNIITGVVRTLPNFVQVAYKVIMGSILLTPAEGARASLFAATNPKALLGELTLAPYFESQCVLTSPSKAAVDDDAAAALWEQTIRTFEALKVLNKAEGGIYS
jgi:retinol dehydrogenase-12